MERSLPTTLWAPARHVGATSYVSTPEDDFTFAFGIFYEDISQTLKERVDDNQGVDLATRFTWSPIYANEGRHVVHVGGGAVYTEDRDEQLRFSTRPEVHEGTAFVDTGTFDADYYFRFNSEAAVVWGPASIQTEGFYVTTNGINGFADMDFYGAYVYASYFLTGENRVYHRGSGAFGRVAPITNFWAVPTCDGTDVGSGAWEAALRWSYVDLNDNGLVAGSRGELHDLTAGLNWYWNPNTRMMFNWIHAFNDRVDVGDNDADILSVRMQVDF